ncbi:hypothetical protein ABPG72_004558 [Tetrahymena utriculariae]
MKTNIITLVFVLCLILSVKGGEGCTSDCANGWKIITDVFYCKSIFGDANCNNDAFCITDFNNYRACIFNGCFGEIGNLSNIASYNACSQKCSGYTQPVKDYAKGFNNCMNVASSTKQFFEIAITIFLFLIYF